jgi:hypothetical protein
VPNPKSFVDDLAAERIDESIPEIQEWMAEGRALVQAASGHQWAIADWMLRGEKTIGIRAAYDFAETATGYSRKTLTDWASVARHSSIRIDNLSFGHHQVVSHLLPEAQKRCLEWAAEISPPRPIVELREMARWELRRLEIDPASAREQATVLLKLGKRYELETLEIMARKLGFKSDGYNSAVGRLIEHIIHEYAKANMELTLAARDERRALAKNSNLRNPA